jgi:Zn-dependent M28 family amino/carboxypeptidase
MRSLFLLSLLLPLAASAAARRDPRVVSLVSEVEPARLQQTVARLVSFGTRNTLSDTASTTRGIGAARAWLAAQFAATGAKPFEDRFTAPASKRIPRPVELVNVGAVVPGSDPARAKEAIVVTGHYDSRASDVMDAKSDAPGAVDDGSGVAMALELARLS